jgi:hypothetical protein
VQIWTVFKDDNKTNLVVVWCLELVFSGCNVYFLSQRAVHDKDINDSQGQDQEELMMKYFTSVSVLLTCCKYTF